MSLNLFISIHMVFGAVALSSPWILNKPILHQLIPLIKYVVKISISPLPFFFHCSELLLGA